MDAQALENLQTEAILASGLTYTEYVQQFMGDELHTEWVNGEVIQILNNVQHNRILGLLQTLLTLYLRFKALGEVFPAGVSMYISDDKPAREPDLMIVFNENRHRIEATRLNGPADIVVEIVSPESRDRDTFIKYQEYADAGVREYWLIDPVRQQADIYQLDEDGRYRRVALDSDGRMVSPSLPGFALDAELFWQEDLPTGAASAAGEVGRSVVGNPEEWHDRQRLLRRGGGFGHALAP